VGPYRRTNFHTFTSLIASPPVAKNSRFSEASQPYSRARGEKPIGRVRCAHIVVPGRIARIGDIGGATRSAQIERAEVYIRTGDESIETPGGPELNAAGE